MKGGKNEVKKGGGGGGWEMKGGNTGKGRKEREKLTYEVEI